MRTQVRAIRARTVATARETGPVRMRDRAQTTRARTAAVVVEIILEIGRFPVPTHRGVQAPSVEHRAKLAPKPVARGAPPAWALPVATVLRVRGAVAADGDEAMNKGKYMNSIRTKTFGRAILSMLLFAAACCISAPALRAASQTKAATTAQPPQKTFDTPQQAADAMILAVKNDDVASLLAIFGPAGKDFVSTGDDVQDKNSRTEFAAMAQQEMHVDIDPHNPNRAILSVGDEDWPTPVPIVKQGGKWHFDSQAGRTEILDRRIGGNELDAITICRGYAEAQKEYASEIHDNSGVNQYAQLIISTPGKQDGLAWRNADRGEGGPVGEAIAKAIAEGYTDKSGPYHGYYFKTLKGQGPAAPLGQLDYVVEGAMIGGFALVAWPAEYRVTGVQTFIVSYDGVVYQKNLGPNTSKIASAMERYNPDKTWHRTDHEE
jgi:hypothetical protein